MARRFIFASLDDIADNFTFFWNLLSYEEISAGSLDSQFVLNCESRAQLHRVVDHLWNSDQPLQRNRLHVQLLPLITAVFEISRTRTNWKSCETVIFTRRVCTLLRGN